MEVIKEERPSNVARCNAVLAQEKTCHLHHWRVWPQASATIVELRWFVVGVTRYQHITYSDPRSGAGQGSKMKAFQEQVVV